jgi:NAD-dependent dihydropyrimidine dehydrogenase PreA subunit
MAGTRRSSISSRSRNETSRFFTPRGTVTRHVRSMASYTIVVDRDRCEGKGTCVEVCPYHVFEVRRIDDADFAALSFLGRLKSRAHRRQSAYTPRIDACHACGKCVVACPEDALSLVKR